MPIGRILPPSAEGNSVIPEGEVVGDIRRGAAVALISGGSSTTHIIECSATYYGDKFYGFAQKSAQSGSNVAIQTMRGSIVTPIIEGGGTISPQDPIFLSRTIGEVAPYPPDNYEAGIFGIEYTGADPSIPSSLVNQSGSVANITGVDGFQTGGETWVFRALFVNPSNCSVQFRITGTDVYFYWNSPRRGDVKDLNPLKATVSSMGGPSTSTSGVISVTGGEEYPIVVMGRGGDLTMEWCINGGAWQVASGNLRKYVTTDYVPGPVVVQVGFGVSESDMTLILDQRIRVL